jgi:hypothetical protein
MKKKLIEVWGWYGMIALLAAYALVSFGVFSSNSFWYQFLNLTGASGIVASGLFHRDYPPAFLNIVWMLIAVFALAKLLIR